MDNQSKFEQMLLWDRDIFQNLVSWKALLIEGIKKNGAYLDGNKSLFSSDAEYKAFKEKLIDSNNSYERELKAYNTRQAEYRNNRFYQAGKSIQEFNDKAVSYFMGYWNFLTGKADNSGVGLAPAIILPLAGIAGGVLVVAAVSYFVQQYYTQTANSLPNVAKAIGDLKDFNPGLAESLVNKSAELNAVAIKENANSGFGTQIGKGVKIAAYSITALAVLGAAYKIAKHRNLL